MGKALRSLKKKTSMSPQVKRIDTEGVFCSRLNLEVPRVTLIGL